MSALPNLNGNAADEAASQYQYAQRYGGGYGEGGHGLGRLLADLQAQDFPRHVWAKVFAANGAAGSALDLRASFCRDIPQRFAPLIYSRRRDAERPGQLRLAANGLAGANDRGLHLFHTQNCSTASCERKASLHATAYSIACMGKIWTTDEEAARLAERFRGVNQAEFARRFDVPGGASMLSQHIKGRRPMNMDAALAYMKGFGVRLDEISPRLAKQMSDSLRELDEVRRAHGNVDMQAQVLSHPAREDAPTAAEVGGRQPPVSFDEAFAKMRPSEQKRFLFLWAAAFDDPPDPTGHIGGIPQWNPLTSAPGASPGKTAPAKKAPGKDKHRRLG